LIIIMSDYEQSVSHAALIVRGASEAHRDAEMMNEMKQLPNFYVAY